MCGLTPNRVLVRVMPINRDGRPKVGLVLGAGGLVGLAHHAGSLAALQNDLNWDPRHADVIVGSSAGSIIATLLRSGISALEIAAWCAGTSDQPLLTQLRHMEEELPPLRITGLFRRWSAPGPTFWGRILRDPRTLRFPPLSAFLPPGSLTTADYRLHMGDHLSRTWPKGLWLCATRRDTGQRVAFGAPGSPQAPLADAVAASCSIPTYFEPVTIDGTEYVDGGLRSSTNADLIRGSQLDVAIVIAPLSTSDPRSREWATPVRWWAHRHVRREVTALRLAGTKVLLIEPDGEVRREMGLDPMGRGRSDRVMRASFFEAGRLVSRDAGHEAIAMLSRRLNRGPRTRATA